MTPTKTQVIIVGAGPTGLVLALWLKKKEISFRIFDKSKGPGLTSRALAIQARTLEFYRQLGFAHRLIDAGITATQLTLMRDTKIVAQAHLGEAGKNVSYFSYLLFCSQDVHEDILCDELLKLGVEVERETELVEFKDLNNYVTVKIKSARGEETIIADYLCGADGAHSLVRKDMPVDFPGGTYSQVFFVADVAKPKNYNLDGVAVTVSREDFCIIMPIQSKGSIRLTGIVPQEVETKEKIQFSDVAESVRRNTGLDTKSVNWFSTYHVHHRVAKHFHKGRIFIAGDAAHIHSPAGGQGMNTGIGDAVNLAWKLADVLNKKAPARLLESYEPERLAFARTLVKTTDTAFRFIASRSGVGSFFRAYVAPHLFVNLTKLPAFIRFMFRTLSQTRIEYRNSFLSEGTAGQVRGGDRLPWIAFENGDNYDVLRTLDWQVHIYGDLNENFRKGCDFVIHVFEWTVEADKKGLMKNAFYLLRPDGYVALASETQNLERLKNWQRQNFLA